MNSPSDDVVYYGTKSSHSGAVITVETPDGEVLGVVKHIAAHSLAPAGKPGLAAGTGERHRRSGPRE